MLTQSRNWSDSQKQMMRQADRFHALRSAGIFALVLVGLMAAWFARWQAVEHSQATIAAGQVRRLLDAETERVPEIILEMEPYRRWTEQRLKDALADAKKGETESTSEAERKRQARRHLHASLAMLPSDASHVPYLYERMLSAQSQDVVVIASALRDHQQDLIDPLWRVVEKPEPGRESQQLRAACALTLYDPASSKWKNAAPLVAAQFVKVSPAFLSDWMDGLRPVRRQLIGPLSTIFHDRDPEQTAERTLATSILADYAGDQPEVLANLTMDADDEQFEILFPKLSEHAPLVISRFEEELGRKHPVTASAAELDALAAREANAGVGLLLLGHPLKVWPLLKHRPDPDVRSYLIHRIAPAGVSPPLVLERLHKEKDVSVRRALLLTLGEFSAEKLAAVDQETVLSLAAQMYRDDPDPGVHGAAGWMLRKWNAKERMDQSNKDLATGVVEGNRHWYLTRRGQTFSVIQGPVEFLMGSPPAEEGRAGGREGRTELQHQEKINHSFAISALEVTVQDFLAFKPDHFYNKQISPTLDSPINNVNWQDAAEYCNWLSDQDKLPPDQRCYVPSDASTPDLKTAPDYLKLAGYRLCEELEWEFACRAGAVTSRYYGDSEKLLFHYAWYIKDSHEDWTIPCGRLKPNEYGLFDMLGNSWERCQDRYLYYASDPRMGGQSVNGTLDQALRGGSMYRPLSLRCADREGVGPAQRHNYIGFRVARTIP
jgi:formylglycine-generating enzyme required for sulfatase activity